MGSGIPFVRDMDFTYGAPQQVSPLIRRVVAANPGPFTFRGTGVYIIGRGEIVIIDPGPDIPGHLDILMQAIAGERLTHIFVTHDHLDHSPAARPLAGATGAKILGRKAGPRVRIETVQTEEDDDGAFDPDYEVRDGEVFTGAGWTIEAITTPGHKSNHVAYALKEENALFSGDHIMGWSTSVISPPDGDMDVYLQSLEKVRARSFDILWPTHGPPVREVGKFVDAYIAHRLDREAQILAQVAAGQGQISQIVPILYAEVDPRLHPAASLSVLAHLIRLVKRGEVQCDGSPALGSAYRL